MGFIQQTMEMEETKMSNSDYDNIFLAPNGISKIEHRGDVDLQTGFYGLYPIISSPMKGISGSSLVLEMGRNNCLGILHRFDTIENRMRMIREVANPEDGRGGVPFGVAIGINDFGNELSVADYAVENGAILICVDIANGYLPQLAENGETLKNKYGQNINLMCGNVTTREGSDYLKESGFNFVRCGIGGGAQCLTRRATGVGRNQLAAIKDCSFSDANIVSDGGIDEPGKAVKSFAFGADFVMLGSILGKTNESENDGMIYGMASEYNHVINQRNLKSIEGRQTVFDPKENRPLKSVLEEFLWGIRSACTYLDCSHYKELQNRDKVRVVPANEW
jgi:GMP reductase